ncbi:hypothetical protein [Sphingomonas turrisvirgatae]|uniref:Peptidase C39-like domain-containing protein n=1 Tax=Sphingomonas turrisvirgatae TaxID=1888892 RepID=A0A1E3M125_9SPHN|nr:hypothetical protein [Sphingomonas turrisvirgatae]ODP39766.1 hypothetical protein BFL28_09085 [Sphingomonas turrisvirgatae]
MGRLHAAARIEPLEQGALDGFCGIYAALNGLRLALADHRELSEVQIDALFARAVELLALEGRLQFAVTWGISQGRWRRLVNALCRSASRRSGVRVEAVIMFAAGARPSRRQVLRGIEGAIDRQRPVLLSLNGEYDHFTVVCAYTPTRLILHDSYIYHWVAKASCGVSYGRGKWRHRIATASIIVLEVRS